VDPGGGSGDGSDESTVDEGMPAASHDGLLPAVDRDDRRAGHPRRGDADGLSATRVLEMRIDTEAPAVARASIEVAATPADIWAVLTDIAQWPTWNPDVRAASIDGAVAPGTSFRWKAGPGTITSTFQTVEPPHLLAWTGRTLGICAVHVYRLEGQGDSILVRSEESWSGLPVRLARRSMQKTLQTSIESALRHLKTRVE
jgi:hypothetical protein